jgi:ppGpp synthetase/RelA/SpoT-type nucleotidyltranferase
MAANFRHTAEDLRREVELILQRVGILCRVFARGKEVRSLEQKMNRTPGKYAVGSKLIQDAIGVRVVVYFAEDVEIVAQLLEKEFHHDAKSSTVDLPENDQFAVTRHNLIFTVPDQYLDDMKRSIGNNPIDITFEVQLRSILSEGWHEVEHDLRYKSKENWETHDDLSRALNGIIATIETSEWTMRKIFDDLAYRNYKSKKWPQMLHNRVRVRTEPSLSSDLCGIFDSDIEVAKRVSRIDRKKVIFFLNGLRPTLPLTLDNIVYAWNHLAIQDQRITDLTPDFVKETMGIKVVSTDPDVDEVAETL